MAPGDNLKRDPDYAARLAEELGREPTPTEKSDYLWDLAQGRAHGG